MFSNIDTCSKSPIPTFSFHIFHLLSYLSSSNLFYHTYYFFTLSIPLLPFRFFLTYFLPFHSYSFLPSLPFVFLLTFLTFPLPSYSSYLSLPSYHSYLTSTFLPSLPFLFFLTILFLHSWTFFFLLTFLTCPLLPFYLSYISPSSLPFLLP